MTAETCLPTTAWFLYDESGAPLGQVHRRQFPEVGVRIEAGEITAFEELRPTCSMRRFKVTLRTDRPG